MHYVPIVSFLKYMRGSIKGYITVKNPIQLDHHSPFLTKSSNNKSVTDRK